MVDVFVPHPETEHEATQMKPKISSARTENDSPTS